MQTKNQSVNAAEDSNQSPVADNKDSMQYPAQNPRTLAETPAYIIAGIAAQLQTPVLHPVERVRLAFDLLDAAASGIKGLKKLGCHHTGLNEHIIEQYDFAEEEAESNASMRPYIQDDVVEFETAMSMLFSRGVVKKDRPSKFALFISDFYLSPEADLANKKAMESEDFMSVIFGHHKTDSEAVLKKWMKEGVPADFFILAQKEFSGWWKCYLSNQRSIAGKKPKKTKQGRVLRRKDKRIGPR
jgi:hypothetical protein